VRGSNNRLSGLTHAFGPPVTASFDVKSQQFAESQIFRVEAYRLQRVICKNISGPPESSLMKPKPPLVFIFNVPVAIEIYFPLAQPQCCK
jgi:hypothetical protein